MNRCSKENCIGWKDCLGFEWYSYGAICYCPFQVIWIIEHACTLSHGGWPGAPSYIDPSVQHNIAEEGEFTLACETIAEIQCRFKTVLE